MEVYHQETTLSWQCKGFENFGPLYYNGPKFSKPLHCQDKGRYQNKTPAFKVALVNLSLLSDSWSLSAEKSRTFVIFGGAIVVVWLVLHILEQNSHSFSESVVIESDYREVSWLVVS